MLCPNWGLQAIALLLISGIQNIEELMMKVEWATLLFFGALFILMEGLGELGLIDAIGTATSDAISDFPDESRKVGPGGPPFPPPLSRCARGHRSWAL